MSTVGSKVARSRSSIAGGGRSERLAEIAAEFVRLKVGVIVTAGTAAVIAVKQATTVIPIVFGTAGDPVGTGLVASLARPGGNVTGLSNGGGSRAAAQQADHAI
jgi:putative tryptophan/tyrosine transport system substrate-binding protein